MTGQGLQMLGSVLTQAGNMSFQTGMRKYDEYKKAELSKLTTDYNARALALANEMEMKPPTGPDNRPMDSQQLNQYFVEQMRDVSKEIGMTATIKDIENTFHGVTESITQQMQPAINSVIKDIVVKRDVANLGALRDQSFEMLESGMVELAREKANLFLEGSAGKTFMGDVGSIELEDGTILTTASEGYLDAFWEDFDVKAAAGVGLKANDGDYSKTLNYIEQMGKEAGWTQEKINKAKATAHARSDVRFKMMEEELNAELLADDKLTMKEFLSVAKRADVYKHNETASYNRWYERWKPIALKNSQLSQDDINSLFLQNIGKMVLNTPEAYSDAVNDIAQMLGTDAAALMKHLPYERYVETKRGVREATEAFSGFGRIMERVDAFIGADDGYEYGKIIGNMMQNAVSDAINNDPVYRHFVESGQNEKAQKYIGGVVQEYTNDLATEKSLRNLHEIFTEDKKAMKDGELSDGERNTIVKKMVESLDGSQGMTMLLYMQTNNGPSGNATETMQSCAKEAYNQAVQKFYSWSGDEKLATRRGASVEETFELFKKDGVVPLPLESGGLWLTIPADYFNKTAKMDGVANASMTAREYFQTKGVNDEKVMEQLIKEAGLKDGVNYFFVAYANSVKGVRFMIPGNAEPVDYKMAKEHSQSVTNAKTKADADAAAKKRVEAQMGQSGSAGFINNLLGGSQ